jgi:hypothetical protein
MASNLQALNDWKTFSSVTTYEKTFAAEAEALAYAILGLT